MAPLWAQANAAAPATKNKSTVLAANSKPIVFRNQRDAFKMSSRQSHPYILLNPEAREKLYGNGELPSRATNAKTPSPRSTSGSEAPPSRAGWPSASSTAPPPPSARYATRPAGADSYQCCRAPRVQPRREQPDPRTVACLPPEGMSGPEQVGGWRRSHAT